LTKQHHHADGRPCLICTRVLSARRGENKAVVAEFAESWFVVGDHQLFPGYGLVLAKNHVREMHDLPAPRQRALFDELMLATSAIARAFKPWKMNHASYGNMEPHVHWHIFPRYADDPQKESPVWVRMNEFARANCTPDELAAIAQRIRAFL